MDKILFSERLSTKRKEKFKSQGDFAAEYDKQFPPKRRDEAGGNEGRFSGIYGTLKKYENPNNPIKPSLEIVDNMCKILECDVDYLLGNINERSHDLQFIHDETGLSEAAIKALQYANSKKNKKDPETRQNKRVIDIINIALDNEGDKINKLEGNQVYIYNNLFTLLYDYIFAGYRGSKVFPDKVSFSYDLSFDRIEYETIALLKEAIISEVRKELDNFKETKKQGK